jgi:hypothetical protein
MTDVMRSADCGNSPKNVLVEALSIALATGDVGGVVGATVEAVRWRITSYRVEA